MRKAVVSPGAVVKANNDLITLANSIGRTVNGNKCSTGASAGQFVVLLNSTISGRADGLYTASQAIPANTAIDSSYLTAADEGGLNVLNSNTVKNYSEALLRTIELYPVVGTNIGGYIDFHFNNETVDFTSRIIESERGEIQINGISIAGLDKRTNFNNGLTVVTDANSAPYGFSQINGDGTNIPAIARYVLFTAHMFTDYYKVQLALADNGEGLFLRNYDDTGSGAWGAWRKLAFET